MIWWALLPRWAKIAVPGVILAAGGALWLSRRAYQAGAAAERLKADHAAVVVAERAREEKAAAVLEAYRVAAGAIQSAKLLHDSVAVVDTVTLTLVAPGLAVSSMNSMNRITVPAIVVRRIVADSVALVAQMGVNTTLVAQVVADSGVITALHNENSTLRKMKTPATCGGKCKAAATVATIAVVGEVAVRVVKLFRR